LVRHDEHPRVGEAVAEQEAIARVSVGGVVVVEVVNGLPVAEERIVLIPRERRGDVP
jgi:hypothetical protein